MTNTPGSPQVPPATDVRPGLAIISNVPRPDRVHVHERLADEIPEIAVHSLFTRSGWHLNWNVELPEKIHAVTFAVGEDVDTKWKWYGNPWKDWKKSGPIIRYCRDHNVRAVIFNGYSSLTAVRVLRWCNRAGVAALIRSDSNIRSERASSGLPLMRWLKKRLVTWFVKRCDAVMPMGELGVQYFEKYGADRSRCFFSPSIPDYRMFSDIPAERVAAFRAKHGLSADRRSILFCGRLTRDKRVDLLVDAFARLAADRPQWDLLIAGSGPQEEELKRRAPEGLADRITWLGFMEWADLPPAYAAADVHVLPSEFEPWAVVVIEAMLAGQVVVASDIVQAAHELFEDGVSGRLFASGSVDSLFECLLDVTDAQKHEQYRSAVGPAVNRWIETRDPIDWTRKALRYLKVIP